MANVISLDAFRAPVKLPPELRRAKSWLVWRSTQMPGAARPRKIPYYISGAPREGPQGEHEPLVSFDRACAAVARGNYSGVGLALLARDCIVALDFDDCVDDRGVIDPALSSVCAETYTEFSPSGRGIRAFYAGSLRDRKETTEDAKRRDNPFGVEVFSSSGYVTVTGNVTPDCEFWGLDQIVAPLSSVVLTIYRDRFGDSGSQGGGSGGDDWLATLSPKIGLSLAKARVMIEALDADGGFEDWTNAGMALHHEFNGSDEAFALYVEWSKRSEAKYPGDRTMRGKWESFGRQSGSPITAAWLLKHARVARVVSRYEAMASWRERLAAAADDYDLREKICPEIARDLALDDLDREALTALLVKRFKAFGTTLPVAKVRRLVQPAGSLLPTVKARRPLTEFGNAERLLDRYGDQLMYVPELDAWYEWSSVYWRRATSVEIEHYAKETVKGLLLEADEHQDQGEFFAFCAESQQARMVRNMLSLAASDHRVLVPADSIDAHPYLLGVMNGVLDLRTGELHAPDPTFRITRVCSCEYVPGTAAPLFDQTLLEVFSGDTELVAYFQRLIGYIAMGCPTEDLMVIAHGNGSNGKSTIMGVIRKVLGGYAKTADPATFLESRVGGASGGNAGGPREDLLRLKGARLVYVNEPDEGGELKEGMVKGMTGGDAISARGMWGKATIEIEPTWTVVMPTNHKPIIKGTDDGIWRRLVSLPFLRNFETDPDVIKDPARESRLLAEKTGVLCWVLAGAMSYAIGGLLPPAVVRAARDQYRAQMDLLGDWIEDCCEAGPGYSEETSRLWASWESYAKDRGILQYIKSSVALGRRMDQKFKSVKGNSGKRMREGIRLKETFENDSDGFFD